MKKNILSIISENKIEIENSIQKKYLDNVNNSIIIDALLNEDYESIRYLRLYGFDMDSELNNNMTPLKIAIISKKINLRVIKEIILGIKIIKAKDLEILLNIENEKDFINIIKIYITHFSFKKIYDYLEEYEKELFYYFSLLDENNFLLKNTKILYKMINKETKKLEDILKIN